MSNRQSGLDTWNDIRKLEGKQADGMGSLPLLLAIAGSLAILPFAILRFLNGEYLIALLDGLIIVGMIALGAFVYRTRRIRLASIILSLLCAASLVATIYTIGTQQILWAYPAVMAFFYLLRHEEAIALVLGMTALLLPKLLMDAGQFQTTSVAVTLVVMCAFAYAFASVMQRQRDLLMQQATKDPLTGAGNRRALDEKLDEIVAAYARLPTPSSLIILDLDHFKSLNDSHGHSTGDEILRKITEIIRLRIRSTDSLYRVGGEEFVVVTEHLTLDKASHLAEQLRTLVEVNELVPEHPVTISLGVAEIRSGQSGDQWLKRADEALYEAKRAGRNATVAAA